MSMITATKWVPRGYAKQFPAKYEVTDEEYERISKLAQLELDDAREDLEEAQAAEEEMEEKQTNGISAMKTNGEIDDDLKEYDLDHYDDDETEQNEEDADMDDEDGGANVFGGLAYHSSNNEDPYLSKRNDEEDEEEREELQILKTDNLILAAKVEDEIAHLEVYVYEDEVDNLYVHHDVMLPALPLAVEWINYNVGESNNGEDDTGNIAAIGTMEPDIELWSLDIVDCMYPNAVLGEGASEEEFSEKRKKKKKRSKKPRDDYHVDAVLSLAANRQHRNLLASASADKTVKLWDLNTTKCAKSYSYHTDKVCALAWHPQETTALLSGSYDKTIIAGDMRAVGQGSRTWRVESDVENLRWDPHDPNYFYVSTESGILHKFDARTAPNSTSNLSPSVWRLQAHDSSLSSFDINPIIPGFIATGSDDKTVKLWNVESTGPSMVVSRDLGDGRVFSTNFAPDKAVGFRLAVAGSKGNLQIWDTSTNGAIRRTFRSRVGGSGNVEDVQEKLISVLPSDTEESDDEDLEAEQSGFD